MKQKEIQRGQFIENGFPKEPGLFLTVFDREGNYAGSGQMVRYKLNPAVLVLEKRAADVSSLTYRLLGLEAQKILIEIPFSEIGGVELEPGVWLMKSHIFTIDHARIKADRSIRIGSLKWNPDRCVPLQKIKKLKNWLSGDDSDTERFFGKYS